ncbi:MAG: M3 family oligoendopeptidase [Treponemataceae bacterium]
MDSKNSKNSKNLPDWNMKSIYSNFKCPEYLKDIEQIKSGIEKLKSLNDKIFSSCKSPFDLKINTENFCKFLIEYTKLDNQTSETFENLFAYANCIISVDTTNVEALNNISMLQEIGIEYSECEVKFRQIFSDNYKSLDTFFDNYPEYENYDFIFREEKKLYDHQMSAEEEKLVSNLQRFGGSAWENLHDQIISNLTDFESGKTFNQLRSDAYNQDRNVRKTSFEKEINLLKQNEIALAACLNNVKGQTIALNKKRNWKNPLDKALFYSRLDKATLSSMIETMKETLPMWQEYFELKALLLNLKDENGNPEKCHFYDIFAPVSYPDKKTKNSSYSENCYSQKLWTFEEAQNYISEKFFAFSKDMGNFVKTAFSKNWIDAAIKKGKVGGAFCCDFPKTKESRILTNFSGSTSDVITLAHELGHAYHHYCIKDLDYNLCSYPMTLAETASLFAETMITECLYHEFPKEQLSLLEMHLSESSQIIVDILSRFYFEKAVFENREKGELIAKDFCELMLDSQKKTYGNSLCEYHPYMWAVKTHYYSPDLDFYNFPYAFGQLFAMGLYGLYKKAQKDFPLIYQDLLKKTGYRSCEQICQDAGFDITKKDFWKFGINQLSRELQKLKTLVTN